MKRAIFQNEKLKNILCPTNDELFPDTFIIHKNIQREKLTVNRDNFLNKVPGDFSIISRKKNYVTTHNCSSLKVDNVY